jgi:hypothetical protein
MASLTAWSATMRVMRSPPRPHALFVAGAFACALALPGARLTAADDVDHTGEEVFTLTDGRTVTGVYDADHNGIRVHVGKSIALVPAKREEIVSEVPSAASQGAAAQNQAEDDAKRKRAEAKAADDAAAAQRARDGAAQAAAAIDGGRTAPRPTATADAPPAAPGAPINDDMKPFAPMDAKARAAYWKEVRGYDLDLTMSPAQMDQEAKRRDDEWQAKFNEDQARVAKEEQALHAATVLHQANLDKQAKRDLDDLLHPPGTTTVAAAKFPSAFIGDWTDAQGKVVWRFKGTRRTQLASGMEEGYIKLQAVVIGADPVRFMAVSQLERPAVTIWRLLDDGRIEETHVEDGALKAAPITYTIVPTKPDPNP